MVDLDKVANEVGNILHFVESTLKFLDRKRDRELDNIVKWRLQEARDAALRLQGKVTEVERYEARSRKEAPRGEVVCRARQQRVVDPIARRLR